MVIRQLEFAVLQLTQQLSEMMDAMQYVLLGKFNVNRLKPNTSHNVVWKVSLHLPDDYEFLARAENIHLYQELVDVAIVGDSHFVKLF